MSKTRKALSTLGLVGVIAFSSACSGGAGSTSEATPEPEATAIASAVASESAAPVETQGANVIDGIPVKEGTVNNGRGEYRQTTISTDDPAMEYKEAIVGDEAKASFTEEEILEAQQTVVTLIAEETIDSTVQGGTPADFDAWWEKNKDKFHPVQSEAIYAGAVATADTDALVIRSQWRQGYDYEYGPDKIRISEREITPTAVNGNVGPDGSPFLSIVSDVSFTSSMLVDGEPKKETTTGVATYSMLQDKADGNKWKIVGYNTTFKGVPLK